MGARAVDGSGPMKAALARQLIVWLERFLPSVNGCRRGPGHSPGLAGLGPLNKSGGNHGYSFNWFIPSAWVCQTVTVSPTPSEKKPSQVQGIVQDAHHYDLLEDQDQDRGTCILSKVMQPTTSSYPSVVAVLICDCQGASHGLVCQSPPWHLLLWVVIPGWAATNIRVNGSLRAPLGLNLSNLWVWVNNTPENMWCRPPRCSTGACGWKNWVSGWNRPCLGWPFIY